MQRVFLAFFALVWSALVLFFDGQSGYNVFKQIQSRDYPSVAGTVTHSEVTTRHSSKGGTSYQAGISYRFEHGGTTFTGGRLRFNAAQSSSTSANSLVAAHPAGSTVQVFYNPKDPAESLLFPGLNGSDFMLVLFLTPFNAIMLGFWLGIGAWLRERLFRPAAGGVRIIPDGMSTRVRLPQFGPLGWGLVTAGGLAFVSVFVVGLSTNMQPSIGLALAAIAAVYLAAAGVGYRQWRKLCSGIDDLVINPTEKKLDLPRTLGRAQPLSVAFADIENLTVETVVHVSRKGGRSYTYAPTLRLRAPHSGEQKVADWSDKVKADDFAQWLRQQLGL
jgi:hypothetical protein